MEKLYYTIGEVASALGERVSLVRFWSDSFPKLIKPYRNAKGNRLFTASDLAVLRQIHFLVRERGLTLEGAQKRIREDNSPVEPVVAALDILESIRERLDEVRKSL